MPELKLYPERINDELQRTLYVLLCGGFCGFVFGFVIGVIFF